MSPMDIALQEARAAYARGEVPVGAVIVNNHGKIIAQAGNQTEATHLPTAHAEILAINAACTALQQTRLIDYDLYVTLEPCPMCAQAISFARIRRLYYAASDPKSGGVEHGARIYNAPSCHHQPEIYSGIHECVAKELLQQFFRNKR